MSLSQSSEINLTDNGKQALNAKKLANEAQTTADSAINSANNAYDLANGAQKTADGKNSVYRGSDPSTAPTSGLKEGDIYFTDNALYTWNGFTWEKTVSDTTGAEIHEKVDKAIAEKDKAIADMRADINADVAKINKEIEQTNIKTGNALNFYKEQYYLSTSYTELEGGSWSDTVPTKTPGKYVWSRYVTANIGDSENYQYGDPVCISGLDGETGPRGLQGLQGPKGDQGIQGQTGATGPQGPQGVSSYTHIAYSDSEDGKNGFDTNNGSGKDYIGIYVDSNPTDSTDPTKYMWTLIKGEQGNQGIPGAKGADGRTPYFHIAYANSSDGTIGFDVSNSVGKLYIGQYTDYTPDDSIKPSDYSWTKIKGETGATGAQGPQGPKGNTGQTGATGPQGPQGVAGAKGTDGRTTYVHVAYANSADGKSNFNTNYFNNALYVGVLTDYTQSDSTDYTKYTWSRLKGDTGATGAQGPTGARGPAGADGKSPQPNLARYDCLWANSAKSLSYDQATNTYTIVNNKPDASWGSSVSIGYILIPFGQRYTASAEIYSPVATSIVIDFNNSAHNAVNWVGNDNDDISTRKSSDLNIPANTWTTITWSTTNTNSSNINKVDLTIYDSIGSMAPDGTTWKLRNLKVELGDTATPWTPNEADLVGPKGDTGAQGIPGPKGANGQTTYVHFAYANSADGRNNFNVNYFNNALYVGTYTDYSQTDSNDCTRYTWSRLKGDTGQTGATGPQGPQGANGTDAATISVKAYTWSAANGARSDIELTGPNAFKQSVWGRGHNVWVLDASTHQLREFINCDTYLTQTFNHNGTNTTLANYLSGLTNSIVVIASADADSVDQDLRNVLNQMGGSPEFGTWGGTRFGHVFIGMSKRSDGTWPLQPRQGYEEVTWYDGSAPEIGCVLTNGGIVANGAKGDQGQTGATGPKGDKGDTGSTGFFTGNTPPSNPAVGTVWATNDSSGNMTSAKRWDGSKWVSTAFTQDLVAGTISATKIQGGELDVNKITVKNAQNIPITSTVSLGDKLSDIKQDADGLSATVLGGGNLLNNTSDTLQSFTGTDWVWCYVTSDDEPVAKHKLDGQKVTLSAWIENPSKEAWVQMYTNMGTARGNKIPAGGSGWSQVTYTMPSGFTYWNIVVGCGDGSGTITLSYSSLQLELGPNRTAWSQSTADIAQLKVTANNLNAYVKGSRGSKTLESILSMDPDHSSIAQVVNGQIAAAIGTYSDGSVRIDGKALYINANTKIENATIKSAMIDSIDAGKITTGELDAHKVNIKNLTADHIVSGTLNGMTITGSQFVSSFSNKQLPNDGFWTDYRVVMDSSGMTITGQYDNGTSPSDHVYTNTTAYIFGNRFYQDMTTNDWTRVIDINTKGENPSLELTQSWRGGGTAYTYVGSDMIWSNQVKANDGWFGEWRMQGSKVKSQNNGSLYVTNSNGTNFDGAGKVGFQIWSGIGLGQNTIYMPSGDLYVQQGNCGPGLGQSYSSAGKVTVHCDHVASQTANKVTSRLSVKTDITPVTYDRALAAVEGTEMYDYRYISDNSGQHYVSGIIDDVNPEPQYRMDDMLISKERDARIDSNLVGYHHVVLQELIKKIDKLQIELNELKSREK